MVGLGVFTWLVFGVILLLVSGFVVLLILPASEREIDILEVENTKIRLENQLRESEFLQLSQQIQPHFMFNTFNALMSLARMERTDDLVTGMESFSRFLRYKYQDKEALVPFESELQQIRYYLSVQSLRFGSKLTIDYQLDPYAVETRVAPYTLHTLVENAFKHGLEKKAGEKRLSIRLAREGSWVRLSVEDNGNTEGNSGQCELGTGLTNIKKRLELLFDLHTNVEVIQKSVGTTVAEVVWPYTGDGAGTYESIDR